MFNLFFIFFLSSCIFVPETAEEPEGAYVDQLALGQIMDSTGYSFSYGGYEELFVSGSGYGDYNLFTDLTSSSKKRSIFIERLNSIISEYGGAVEVSWSGDGSGDFLFENDKFEKILGVRSYQASTPDVIFRDKVEIVVRYDEQYKWQILYWREIENENGRYSFFHPDFGN
jgi:hypothetical protein